MKMVPPSGAGDTSKLMVSSAHVKLTRRGESHSRTVPGSGSMSCSSKWWVSVVPTFHSSMSIRVGNHERISTGLVTAVQTISTGLGRWRSKRSTGRDPAFNWVASFMIVFSSAVDQLRPSALRAWPSWCATSAGMVQATDQVRLAARPYLLRRPCPMPPRRRRHAHRHQRGPLRAVCQ